jgi:hypothetical protein
VTSAFGGQRSDPAELRVLGALAYRGRISGVQLLAVNTFATIQHIVTGLGAFGMVLGVLLATLRTDGT